MKQHKFKAQRTEIDGIKFASKKEANRYVILKLMDKQGYIRNLRLQVPYDLNPGGAFKYRYFADFVYEQGNDTIVEDCKGYLTREYKKKRALMLKIHNIKIKEV